MACNIKKLPKWAIKQAGGINKKAWALARRGPGRRSTRKGLPKRRGKKVARLKRGRRSNPGPRKPMGIVGKLNAGLRGLRFGLPAIGEAMTRGLNADTPRRMLWRYSSYDMGSNEFDLEAAKTTGGFYVGNVVEKKVMGFLRIPQMAGQKKILSVAANFLPEITAIPHLMEGNHGEAVNQLGRASIGYQATDHQSFIENETVRNEWLKHLFARIGLGVVSKFAGPMINPHLPKGVGI